jgi:hypothetical protein
MNTKNIKEYTTELLAFLAVFGSLAIIILMFFVPVPQENRDMVNVLSGTVLSGSGMVLSYYFGQSKKRDILPEAGTTTTIVQSATTEENKEPKI